VRKKGRVQKLLRKTGHVTKNLQEIDNNSDNKSVNSKYSCCGFAVGKSATNLQLIERRSLTYNPCLQIPVQIKVKSNIYLTEQLSERNIKKNTTE